MCVVLDLPTHVCVHVCMYVHTYILAYTYMYECVCAYILLCTYMYICRCVHTWKPSEFVYSVYLVLICVMCCGKCKYVGR